MYEIARGAGAVSQVMTVTRRKPLSVAAEKVWPMPHGQRGVCNQFDGNEHNTGFPPRRSDHGSSQRELPHRQQTSSSQDHATEKPDKDACCDLSQSSIADPRTQPIAEPELYPMPTEREPEDKCRDEQKCGGPVESPCDDAADHQRDRAVSKQCGAQWLPEWRPSPGLGCAGNQRLLRRHARSEFEDRAGIGHCCNIPLTSLRRKPGARYTRTVRRTRMGTAPESVPQRGSRRAPSNSIYRGGRVAADGRTARSSR